jgi:micrococcal nuclease
MGRNARSGVLLLLLLALVVGGILVLQAMVGPHRGGASSPAGASGMRVRATVIGISDGDTIRVRLDDGTVERVRYVGIDAPEIAHPQDGIAAECLGPEAASADAALVDGHEVWLERDVSDRDRFGRLLRHVWVARDGADVLVAEELVREGMAEARSYPPDTARDLALERAEADARVARRGVWGAC